MPNPYHFGRYRPEFRSYDYKTCPFCKSDKIEKARSIINMITAYKHVKCKVCGEEWTERISAEWEESQGGKQCQS